MREMLIIKTGHCETFCEFEDRGICSLGDVLRSSFLINYYSDFKITWITDRKAAELFQDTGVNLVFWNDWESLDLTKFERIINLEKKDELLDSNFEGINLETLPFLRNISDRRDLTYQESLCLLLGIKWNKEPYAFRKSLSCGEGVGLNWKVGEKFPQKSLPKKFWEDLEESLASQSVVKWQEGFEDLNEYINWIDSLDTLITLDSLGAHIGISLGKNVICLFGPTNENEVYIYDRGIKINIENLEHSKITSLIRDALYKES